MEAFGLMVEDKSRLLPGMQSKQAIITSKEYEIPLSIQGGLPYLDSSKPAEQDLEMYPAIFMTADISWDPIIFDNNHEQIIKKEFVTSENYDMFIDSDNKEIDLYATNGKIQM